MRILVAAGGTGGHVFPALAVGTELEKLGVSVVWAGRSDGLERRVAQEHGFEFATLGSSGFSGKSLPARVKGLWMLLRGVIVGIKLLRRTGPDAVVGTGGFACAALLAGSWLLGVPYFLVEQNCIPGRVTRFFAPRARETMLGFPTAKPFRGRHAVTGNPLRPEIAGNRREDDGRTVLVVGGSLGSRPLNLAALDAATALLNLNFIILSGTRDHATVKSLVRSHNCEIVEFTARPEELYRRATIAVSRAGGMVLSELVAFGIPAIIVPFPHATDKHQDANAQYLASLGAAFLLDQSRLSGLTSLVRTLVDDTRRRTEMESACRRAARPDAAAVIAQRVVQCLAG